MGRGVVGTVLIIVRSPRRRAPQNFWSGRLMPAGAGCWACQTTDRGRRRKSAALAICCTIATAFATHAPEY